MSSKGKRGALDCFHRVVGHETSHLERIATLVLSLILVGIWHQTAIGQLSCTFTQITSTTGGSSTAPSINADGTRIAFASDMDFTGGNADGNWEIFLFDATTGTFTQITNTTGGGQANFSPSINADGTRIAFYSDRDLTGGNADGNREIFLSICLAEAPIVFDLSQYYPLQVGNVWLNRETLVENGDTRVESSRDLISRSIFIEGTEVFIIGELDPGCWEQEGDAQAWDSEGLKSFGFINCEGNSIADAQFFDPPVLQFPREMELGESRSWSVMGTVQITVTLQEFESVTVPAGIFDDALRFEMRIQDGENSELCCYWIVQDIGIVKRECELTEGGETEECTDELIAAIIGGTLVGSPLQAEDMFSALDLAYVSTNGCGMVLNNVVVQGAGGPEIWWAGFEYDMDSTSWIPINADPGISTPPFISCETPQLDFGQALSKLGRDNVSGLPEIWMRISYEEQAYGIAFLLSLETLSWDLLPFLQPLGS
ncbi:MAG: PD40 domain-containing protein [Deltaproteobacteria bacterium]|nr:PD40 domain-containing protein [Deltaproteobacteria bacterium]